MRSHHHCFVFEIKYTVLTLVQYFTTVYSPPVGSAVSDVIDLTSNKIIMLLTRVRAATS